MGKINIGNKIIDENHPPYFIADIGANHDGELERAFKLIELAKDAGANAAKFQNFKAKSIVSKKGFESITDKLSHQSKWEKTVYEVYQDASISREWTQQLKSKCDDVGIDYFTSPYDIDSVDHVDPFVDVYKIGSGDITWLEIIEYIAKKNKPVLLATGASTWDDVVRAMSVLESNNKNIVLMQCNTNYTGLYDNFNYINLNVLKKYSIQFPEVVLGLSDHTFGHSTVLGAITLGARVIEKHFTDNNLRNGPDHKFAMNPKTWKEMVDRSNELFLSLGDGVKRIEKNETDTSIVQRRALRYTCALNKGTKISSSHLIPVRPIQKEGLPPYRESDVIGKILVKNVETDDLVKLEQFKND